MVYGLLVTVFTFSCCKLWVLVVCLKTL